MDLVNHVLSLASPIAIIYAYSNSHFGNPNGKHPPPQSHTTAMGDSFEPLVNVALGLLKRVVYTKEEMEEMDRIYEKDRKQRANERIDQRKAEKKAKKEKQKKKDAEYYAKNKEKIEKDAAKLHKENEFLRKCAERERERKKSPYYVPDHVGGEF